MPHPVAMKPPFTKSTLTIPNKGDSAVRDVRSFSAGTVGMPNTLSLVAPTSGSVQMASSGSIQDTVVAPPPPPRSWHSRSASLDLQGQAQSQAVLNRLNSSGQPNNAAAPPQLPPRTSPIVSVVIGCCLHRIVKHTNTTYVGFNCTVLK